MKSIEKLRQFLEDQFGSDRFAIHEYGYTQGMAIAKSIEKEIAELYMLLPVDADGVPIHIGDICEMSDDRFEVRQLKTDGDYWWVFDRLGDFYIAELCRHVKPRTLEDVLRDVWQEALDYAKSDMWRNPDEVFAERADEIRELLGGDIDG